MRRVLLLPLTAQPWKDMAYLKTGVLAGGLAWLLLLAGPLTGFPACLVLIGFPWLWASIWLTDRFAELERRRAALVLGHRIASPGRRRRTGGFLRQLGDLMASPRTWREMTYLLLLGVVALATEIAGFAAFAGGWGMLTGAIWWWSLPNGLPLGIYTADTVALQVMTSLVLGPPLVVLGSWIQHGCARAQAHVAQAMLDMSAEERVGALEASRAGAVDAAAAELRRIERDLHDGAQARLVALAMDIGMAREQLERDPGAAASLLERSHADAKAALVELRDLARGIHPAILSDRGLDAAVSALAARCPVPCTVEVDLPRRPPAHVESAAYFTIAEALTNVARHSDATACAVTARANGATLVAQVRDNGRGGADPSRGTGIAGLRGRVEALDGTLEVNSPADRGTLLRAEIPCGS